MPGEEWQHEYKERVFAEFKRVHEDIEKVGVKVDELKDDTNSEMRRMDVKIAIIEQKNKDSARIWGILAGAITSVIVSLVIWALTSALTQHAANSWHP